MKLHAIRTFPGRLHNWSFRAGALCVWLLLCLAPAGPLLGQTSGRLYTVDFPGGTMESFVEFWRTNGFADDNMLIVGPARQVDLPKFTLTSVRVGEVAKSIEFISKGQLRVEVVEKTAGGNLWRINAVRDDTANAVRVRACPAPHIFAGGEASQKQLEDTLDRTRGMLHAYRDRRNVDYEDGEVRLIPEQRIVVAVGPEYFVEAMANVVDAAEAAAPKRAGPFNEN